MKYLRRYLIHAGFCILLVCSANGVSAQVVVSITTQTEVGRVIDFNLNLSRQLMTSEVLGLQFQFKNVSYSEATATVVTRYTVSSQTCMNSEMSPGRFPRIGLNPLAHDLCIDGGVNKQDLALKLILSNSFDTRKTITISIRILNDRNINGGAELGNSVLSYPGTAIFVRSKVFLEGPLQ